MSPQSVRIYREYYEAGGGIEVLLSAEDRNLDVLVGLLRFRVPSDRAHRSEVRGRAAIVRELHVFGVQAPVGEHCEFSWQHKGWDARLLGEAEEIAKYEFSCSRILILAGVGAREYYRRHGYVKLGAGPYMVKRLRDV